MKIREYDRLLKLFDWAEIAAFQKNEVGRYVFMSPFGARMIGKDLSEVIGRNDFELFENRSAAVIVERDQYIKSLNRAYSYRSVAKVPGRWKLFRSLKLGLSNRFGESSGVFGLSADESDFKLSSRIQLLNRVQQAFGLYATKSSRFRPLDVVEDSLRELLHADHFKI